MGETTKENSEFLVKLLVLREVLLLLLSSEEERNYNNRRSKKHNARSNQNTGEERGRTVTGTSNGAQRFFKVKLTMKEGYEGRCY